MSRPRMLRIVCVVAALAGAGAGARAEDAAKKEVPKGSTLGEMRKEHGVAGPDGRASVRIVAPAEVVGLQGSTVACVLFFEDAAGKSLTSPLAGFNDRAGAMRAVSADTKVAKDPDGIDFAFLVPYAAFPKSPAGKYQVDVRARLVLRGAAGTSLLAETHTRFWVEG